MTPTATKKLALSKEGDSPPPSNIALAIASLGIVFGDIGTSPLYALQVALGTDGLAITENHVRGVLSLVFWSLLLVVGIKYVILVMRADHGGEGGGSDGGACARLHVPLSISPCAELDADPRLLDTVPVVAITNHANPPRLGAMTPRY